MNHAPAPVPPDARRRKLAAVLDVLGPMGLPLGIGVGLGYWLSDRGVRWMPDIVEGLLLLAVCSLLFVLSAMRLRREHIRTVPGGVQVRRTVAVIFLGLAVASGGWLAKRAIEQPAPLTVLAPETFARAYDQDTERFREHSAGLAALLDRLEDHPMFGADADEVLGPEDEALLLDAWLQILDYTTALEGTRRFYEDWYRFDPSRRDRPRLLRAFLLSLDCELVLVENAARIGALVRRNKHARKFLDAPHADAGLPANSFGRYSQSFEGADDQAYVLAGAQTLEWMDELMDWRPEAWSEGLGWLWTDVEDRLDVLAAMGLLDRAAMVVGGETQFARRGLRQAWMPAQQEVAEWFGNTKLRRVGWYLIDEAQQAELAAELEPGDILVTRKNWYMSNVGLPGWWPHGILYIGDPAQLALWADDPGVAALVEELAGRPMAFDAYMAQRYPHDWLRYQLGQDGSPIQLIEANSAGVILANLATSAGDSLGALRPRLDKRAKAQAIIEAFSHLGKTYDYDFDFATDNVLVCTELVWRSYRPAEGKEGIEFPVVTVAGRRTMPAIEIVNMYIRERGLEDRQLDFVAFYDADESAQVSRRSTEEEFVRTPDRPRWGFAD